MFTSSIFKTSIKDKLDKNKFFQCFVCLQQFNSSARFPMEICQKQHFMCLQCVRANSFKRNPLSNGYQCSLCSSSVQTAKIKKSPFLLSIKDFIEVLMQRENVRKEKYKQCMKKQSQLAEELMEQNISKTEKIQLLQKQVREQQQLINRLLQSSQQQNAYRPQSNAQLNNVPRSIFTSTIGFGNSNMNQNKNKIPSAFQSMFNEIQKMKQEIKSTEYSDREQYDRKLKQLQKQQFYLYEIIENQHEDQKIYAQKRKTIFSSPFPNHNQNINQNYYNQYPNLSHL